jgi:hypothetical protein
MEVWPATTKDAATSAFLFKALVIARYGAPAQVISDGGPEFRGQFHEMLTSCLVDHRYITPGSPQSNGLAERAVQSCKLATAKIGAMPNVHENTWDMLLQNFLTAYRITKQASTKYSPYELLFAREPVLPGELQRAYQNQLDFDADTPGHLEALTADLLERASRLATATPLCLANLQVEQHRDTLRYALTRSGNYLPRLREFQVGDLVYVIKTNHGPTQPGTHDDILQIMGFEDSGVANEVRRCRL